MSHLAVHIGRSGRLSVIVQPRRPDGTFDAPLRSASPVPATSHFADYTLAGSPRITRTRLR